MDDIALFEVIQRYLCCWLNDSALFEVILLRSTQWKVGKWSEITILQYGTMIVVMKRYNLNYIMLIINEAKEDMIMEIRRTSNNDMDTIQQIYAQARAFMKANGNPNQWINQYPVAALIEQDIASNHSYVCIDDGEIVGTFFFKEGTDPTYAIIDQGEWLNNEPYGVVHRLASSNGKRGVATFCLNWCYEQCGNIRIDTHKDNLPMQNLLKKNGYVECGIIYVANGDERIAFQKSAD